ncbi:MAG: methyltransferase domain-containing protein [Pseudonocardiaceae bacterium]|nr:methyltransferase domain-containing protein [Pseudonocardiaceae bacterium]
MAMNWFHRRLCGSQRWARYVESDLLPWALRDVELGEHALEIGPGYGANLRVLATRVPKLTAVEVSAELAARLDERFGSQATVIHGDGAATGLPECEFTSVVCFTMLHHVPTSRQQDALFAEAYRLLRPGGTFAGSDGVHSFIGRLVHLRDTYNPIDPNTLPERLATAGFADVQLTVRNGQQRFRARKPDQP